MITALRGGASVAIVVGVLLGFAGTAVVLRLWGPLVAATGALALGWFIVGAPAVDAATPSFRRFAEEAHRSFPGSTALAFWGPPVRSVVVYVGHPVPSLDRDRARIEPGLGVIATVPAYARLAADHRLGPPIVRAEGQIANVERGMLVLAEGREKIP